MDEENLVEEIKRSPYSFICDFAESVLMYVGRKTFEIVSLQPCSEILPPISRGSEVIDPRINYLHVAGFGTGSEITGEADGNTFLNLNCAYLATALKIAGNNGGAYFPKSNVFINPYIEDNSGNDLEIGANVAYTTFVGGTIDNNISDSGTNTQFIGVGGSRTNIQNIGFTCPTSAEAQPRVGSVYYNSGSNILYVYSGSGWAAH